MAIDFQDGKTGSAGVKKNAAEDRDCSEGNQMQRRTWRELGGDE